MFVYIGARYTVESIIQLSTLLTVDTDIIAMSAIAVGTSLQHGETILILLLATFWDQMS